MTWDLRTTKPKIISTLFFDSRPPYLLQAGTKLYGVNLPPLLVHRRWNPTLH